MEISLCIICQLFSCFTFMITKKGNCIFLNLGICLLGTLLVKDWNSALICSTIYFGEKDKSTGMYSLFVFEFSFFFPSASEKKQNSRLHSLVNTFSFYTFLHSNVMFSHILSPFFLVINSVLRKKKFTLCYRAKQVWCSLSPLTFLLHYS